MPLKRLLRLRHTLAFRLTLWYGVIFTLSSFTAFLIFYAVISYVIQARTDQHILNEVDEISSLLSLKGVSDVKTSMVLEAESEGVDQVFFRLLTPEGDKIHTSNAATWGDVGVARSALHRIAGGERRVFETLTLPKRPHKVRIAYGAIGPGEILQMGQSLEEDERFLEVFREIFGTVMILIILFSGLIGWFMAKRALSGIEEVTSTALDISRGDLDRRVRITARNDEIEKLATTFNTMVDRIHVLMTELREVTDNIAHDLRSPITRIRGLAETTLTAGRSREEYEAMAAQTLEECDRLINIVNTTLEISESEAGAADLRRERVDLSVVAGEACDLFQAIAEDKEITMACLAPDACLVWGDLQRLQRMVANLLDNALKYTPPQGNIEVSVRENKSAVSVSVTDTGIGISRADLPYIFDRFFRCDPSRSKPGAGLGLSLARAIARAHGGDITVTSLPDQGSTFTVTLPKMPLTHETPSLFLF
ncbi:MAG: ATP-binding protein [Pseudomonadota bacterium]